MEEWKKIDGYEHYSVSKDGKVRNDKSGRILKAYYNKYGYQQVKLYKNRKGNNFLIHRLVAEAFIPNPENFPCIDHINTIRDDNRVENLRWCTVKENNNNPLTQKKLSEANSDENNPRARKIICVTTGEVFDFIKQAEEKYGVNCGNISLCCSGERKSAGKHPDTGEKLIWMFLEDYLKGRD